METLSHTLSDGTSIIIRIKHSAKKNLILHPIDTESISINVPPFLSKTRLNKWLHENETLLRKTLEKTPQTVYSNNQLPEKIWFRGNTLALRTHATDRIVLMPSEILVPQTDFFQQQTRLRRFLHRQAAASLLPLLHRHAHNLNQHPKAAALSNAKTFWGVCRPHTGIQLNWRLIGAPDFVADYVCIHELCHLLQPNHSPAFWHLVSQHTPHVQTAKNWLKTHGRELFALG